MLATGPADETNAAPSLWRRLLPPLLAVFWLIVFYVLFFSRPLPNAQTLNDGSRPTRWLIVQYVGEILLDDLLPIREEGSAPAGLAYLPQRAGFVAVAAVVYLMAYLLGTGLMHLVSCGIKIFERPAWHALALAVGLSALSLITLFLGLLGLLQLWAFLIVYAGIVGFWAWVHAKRAGGWDAWRGRMRSWGMMKYYKWSNARFDFRSPRIWGSLIIAPFLWTMLLGAMLPSVDFDVKEYHFGGPKEYYQAGEIRMLPHDVYTSFPFLTEMLTLTGMVLYGDWYWGAIAGKTILFGFAPLTAWLVKILVQKWFGRTAGWLAAIVHLSIPWTYRISIIAYTEGGLSLYVAATALAAAIAAVQLSKKKTAYPCVLVCGFLAGSAAACKYPGLISVTIPVALFLLAAYIRAVQIGLRSSRQLGMAAGVFVLGTLISFGPWLAKNLVETGNPVYPLLYSVFGGTDWDATMDAKWKRAHSPDHHELSNLATSLADVVAVNDWQSVLIGSFGLIGLIGYFSRRPMRWMGLYLLWLFVTWWVLTHRIDRFWVPLLPIASAVAGCGAYWLSQRSKVIVIAAMAPALIFNQAFITTELSGYNAYVIDLNAARQITARITSPETVFLNQYMKNRRGKVLSVGEAELFDATFPYAYNTVFDRSLFAEWTGVVDRDQPEGEWEMRSPAVIRELFRQNDIREILVNWQEILRYRLTYGYTDYVTPDRFRALQEAQLIGPAVERAEFLKPAESLSEDQRREIEAWAPELLIELDGKDYFITTQVFPVL